MEFSIGDSIVEIGKLQVYVVLDADPDIGQYELMEEGKYSFAEWKPMNYVDNNFVLVECAKERDRRRMRPRPPDYQEDEEFC